MIQTYFPVTRSILSDRHLGALLINKYSLHVDATCRLIKTFVNDTYLVTSNKEKYIFRVYSVGWRSEKEISEEIRLIDILRLHGISVSYAIADAQGIHIQQFAAPEGVRFGVLFTFAKGGKHFNVSPETHERLGAVMATIHRTTDRMKLERTDYTPKVMLIDSFEKFKSYLSEESDEMKSLLKLQEYALREFHGVRIDAMRHGAVHLDIWADNLHVDEAMNITLFDFDFCGNGWLCYDIAFYLLMLSSTEPNATEYRRKSEYFLKGYQSVVGISDEEKRILPAAVCSLCFFYLGVQSERFATIFFNEEHVKRFVNFRLKKWLDYDGISLE